MLGAQQPQNNGNYSQPMTASGDLFAGLGGLFAGSQMENMPNPANAAMPYYNQVPGAVTPLYQPYINAGTSALSPLQQQLQQIISNPSAYFNQMGSNYQASPGYNWQVNQATQAANHAAAAGGMAGSPQEQQQLAQAINGMAGNNYYQYMGGVGNLLGQGLGGMSNLANLGYMGSNNLAQTLASNLMSQGNLAYTGQENQNNAEMAGAGAMGGAFGALGQGIGLAGGVGSLISSIF